MKLEKEKLIEKVNSLEVDDEIKIPLLEDITDSFEEKDTKELEELQVKYDELKEKYKERFIEGTKEVIEEPKEELEERKYIDIKEI